MINPPGESHSVMQLNMGEGKTAVIVPILAARLSDQRQMCQVTVLKSLFRSNLKSLRQCLGGMLNRRVYTMPCRRDMSIGQSEASAMLASYRECKDKRGIIMTLPEYRCSFQLKMYETARKGETATSNVLMATHQWLNSNARNILDESDAILHAKYQLIYTVGEQLPPGGGELRWTVVQDLLKLVPGHMRSLWQVHGNEKIEIDEKNEGDVEKFTPCRILDASIYKQLKESLADDFIAGRTAVKFPQLKATESALLKRFITDKTFESPECDEFMRSLTGHGRNTVLILCGLLKYEVLSLVLRRRWRVNYGVNQKGHRKMAVPFIAKDVCAENTEFGHPDVAIAMTHLSYYYSGLTDKQLYECFDLLEQSAEKEEKFDLWMRHVAKDKVDMSVRSYSGVNLSDATQREKYLFPVLRRNMYVVDFWLSNCVFPREAKLFAKKMMCTAWDLCSEQFEHVATGFSGTNDTKLLLPKPIVQNDLEELENTNEQVRQTLLLPENDNYEHLPPNVSGLAIIERLVERDIPVLLDSGALMLELNNKQVAQEWLKRTALDCKDAAVYFDERNILMAIDRANIEREFELSAFRERLDRCIIYLDDVHTRGTDLKFPSGFCACVTLTGLQTRDKTVQACMRMRLLGQGHTVRFWASEEADNAIRELAFKEKDAVVATIDVIEFICNNSRLYEKEGLVHWAAAGYNYSQKLAAYRLTHEVQALSNRCTDDEAIELDELYGEKSEMLYTTIIENRFRGLRSNYSQNPKIASWLDGNLGFITVKLTENIPEEKRFAQLLDEEQEKELEHELEEQREIHRPRSIAFLKPILDPRLKQFFQNGLSDRKYFDELINKSIFELPEAFRKTTLWPDLVQEKAWGHRVFVTKDFMTVVPQSNDKEDEFLRPVWWVVSASLPKSSSAELLLVLSQFETNHFKATFSVGAATTLHIYSPRLSPEQNTLNGIQALQLPIRARKIQIAGSIEAQLSILAGSIFFHDRREQDAYCNFVGIIPRPRSTEHQQAFEDGKIHLNGFVDPQHRAICPEIQASCHFSDNPENLIRKIVDRRHGFLPRMSHVSLIVTEGNANNIKFDN